MMQNLLTVNPANETFPPEFYMTFEQIAQKYGFQVDKYSVTTPDHYVLGNFRIRNPGLKAGAPAVFMQHGLFDCSDTWIINQGLLAPAFQMAKAGYDVFLGNNRGNYYSDENTLLNPQT